MAVPSREVGAQYCAPILTMQEVLWPGGVHTKGVMLTEQRIYLESLESNSVLTTGILQKEHRRCLGSLESSSVHTKSNADRAEKIS